MPETDVTIRDVSFGYEDYLYRTPLKFGGVAVDRVTLLTVRVMVETAAAVGATGVGAMPLGNVWAFPSTRLAYADTLAAMKAVADRITDVYLGCRLCAHPIEITHSLEAEVFAAAAAVSRTLAEPVPKLATLVVASAFDAALHDAFGKANFENCYRTYGPDYLAGDLSRFLGADFAGLTLSQSLLPAPRPTLPVYHLVGALDPLTPADVATPVNDGLPESLAAWVPANGLTHLKIKLNGDDLRWDVARVIAVDRVAASVGKPQAYSLDFNERCRSVAYLLAFLDELEAQAPAAFARVQYVEQPTARDLKANPQNRMHAAAARVPVVIDESLLDLETLHLARDMGYSGVAFKACKGQSQTLLLAAAAQKLGLFRCVQDLTCPGASLIQSAGLAAHIPGVAAIEANARQYCPAANAGWAARFPGVFQISGGVMNTGILTGWGLGAV